MPPFVIVPLPTADTDRWVRLKLPIDFLLLSRDANWVWDDSLDAAYDTHTSVSLCDCLQLFDTFASRTKNGLIVFECNEN